MTAQVAADLRAAAEVLRRDGWTQGDYEKPGGCKCVMGALEAATGIVPPDDRLNPHKVAIRRVVGTYPILFNDHPGRTADEVIAALEAAADAAEADR